MAAPDFAKIATLAKAALKLLGTTSVYVLGAVVLGYMLLGYADDINVPEAVRLHTIDSQQAIEFRDMTRREQLDWLARPHPNGVRWNPALRIFEDIPRD